METGRLYVVINNDSTELQNLEILKNDIILVHHIDNIATRVEVVISTNRNILNQTSYISNFNERSFQVLGSDIETIISNCNLIYSNNSFSIIHNNNGRLIPEYYGNYIRTLLNPRIDWLNKLDSKLKDTNDEMINIKPNDEILKKLFKYIPIITSRYYRNLMGFYDFNNKKGIYYTQDGVNIVTDNLLEDDRTIFSDKTLYKYCKFKVKSYYRSSKLFRNSEFKKTLVNNIFEAEKLEIQVKVKRSDDLENTIYIVTPNGKSRFLLEDIEIIYPNVSGYNIPKDRKVVVGSTVRVVKDKHIQGIKRDDIVKINNIKTIGSKIYAGIKVKSNIIYAPIKNFKVC